MGIDTSSLGGPKRTTSASASRDRAVLSPSRVTVLIRRVTAVIPTVHITSDADSITHQPTDNMAPKRSTPLAPSNTDNTTAIALPIPPPGPIAESPQPAQGATPEPSLAKKRRRTNKRVEISPAQLETEFAAALASQRSAEIVVAHLINRYNFDIKFFLNKINGTYPNL